MVIPLGVGKFYGHRVPRPRFYADVKFNDHRVDPPSPVMDPFLSWAHDAHWSMGGLNVRRCRLQGRIEGSVKKLRAERERFEKRQDRSGNRSKSTPVKSEPEEEDSDDDEEEDDGGDSVEKFVVDSAPPAPMALKRRRRMALINEDDSEESDDGDGVVARKSFRRGPVRKLGADFDRVASEAGMGNGSEEAEAMKGSNSVAWRIRSRRSEIEDKSDVAEAVKENDGSKIKGKRLVKGGGRKIRDDSGSPRGGIRVSPRLSKMMR